jgi:hypothetical protein
MPTRSLILWILLAVFSVFFCLGMLWMTYSSWSQAYDGYRIQRDWHVPATPYTARVVGFPIWGRERRESIPTVRITFSDGRTAQFNSSRRGRYSEGDVVAVLTTRGQRPVWLGENGVQTAPYDIYEIDSAYLLWARDALYGVFFLLLALSSPVWGFSGLSSRAKTGPLPAAGGT